MWIQVRTMDGRKNVRIDDLSKLTKIEELREMLVEPFEAEVEKQRLFYRGKQVRENGSICVHCGTWFERVACRSIVHRAHGIQCFTIISVLPSYILTCWCCSDGMAGDVCYTSEC